MGEDNGERVVVARAIAVLGFDGFRGNRVRRHPAASVTPAEAVWDFATYRFDEARQCRAWRRRL
jgi:hypothetical protein